jgi:pimeloyl-ACP methyl ester carboxylesterase
MGGEGPVLVLLHGVGLDHTMWADLLPHLGTDWRIILIDMPGHGGSASPPADAQLDYYAARVVEVLDAANIDRAVLAGFSMGALVARCFALRHPERLDALVLMNGVFDRTEEARQYRRPRRASDRGGVAATSEAALDRWFTPAWRSGHEDVVDQVRQRLNSNDEQGYVITYRLFATQDNYGAELLRTIAVPTLVITGEYDVGSTPDMTRPWQAAFRAPRPWWFRARAI